MANTLRYTLNGHKSHTLRYTLNGHKSHTLRYIYAERTQVTHVSLLKFYNCSIVIVVEVTVVEVVVVVLRLVVFGRVWVRLGAFGRVLGRVWGRVWVRCVLRTCILQVIAD